MLRLHLCLQVFTPHVERWIHNSQDALCQRCHQLEGSTQALQGGATGEDGQLLHPI